MDATPGYPRAESGNVVYNYADDGMPENCSHPRVDELIRAFEAGEMHYNGFEPDETATKEWETFHPENDFT